MTEFQELVAECFMWTDSINTMCSYNGCIYCNRQWWNQLSDVAKGRYIDHELRHLTMKDKI